MIGCNLALVFHTYAGSFECRIPRLLPNYECTCWSKRLRGWNYPPNWNPIRKLFSRVSIFKPAYTFAFPPTFEIGFFSQMAQKNKFPFCPRASHRKQMLSSPDKSCCSSKSLQMTDETAPFITFLRFSASDHSGAESWHHPNVSRRLLTPTLRHGYRSLRTMNSNDPSCSLKDGNQIQPG